MTPAFPASTVSRTLVKICGITREDDARAAAELGADALGFNFWEGSKRFLPPDLALPWIQKIPRPPLRIAVLVNPSPSTVERLALHPAIDAIQLHGCETPDFVAQASLLKKPILKALPLRDPADLQPIPLFACPELLLDSAPPGQFGGSGSVGDWSLAARAVTQFPLSRFFLAGGLNPQNVALAISTVHPFGVDVASGVECAPGVKDHALIEAFILAARNAT